MTAYEMRISDWSSDVCSSDLLSAPQAFLVPAETALGHGIEIIAGREEARLVYLGVAHAQPPKKGNLRLVIDIGGGSTECIIGAGFDAIERESLQVGCVASTRRFFGSGKLTRKRSEEHTSELQSLMRISYAVFCLKKKINTIQQPYKLVE